MSVSAQDVKRLREITGAGMMDCKAALAESNGDFDGAIEVLRKKGQKLSAKRADREANEGVVLALVDASGENGIVVQVSCETDFVAKNDDFVAFAKSIADKALATLPDTKEALLASEINGEKISDLIISQVGKIGEKVELYRYEKLSAATVVPYIHMGNRAGVLVGLTKKGENIINAGKDLAMQIAAMKPVAVDKDDVSQEIISKEIEIGMEIARNEGKPEAMLEKIAQGKLQKFFKESTLLNQAFVKDNQMTIADYLKTVDKDVMVTGFKHLYLG